MTEAVLRAEALCVPMTDANAALLQQGLQLHRQGALAEASRCYADLLARDPQNAEAHYYLATVACQQGRFAEGADLARKSIALNGADARPHNMLGTALSHMGRNAEALAAYEQAIALKSDFASAHGRRADTLAALGRLEEAVAAFDQALAIDPTALPDRVNRGAALIELGRFDEAMANYERLIALEPNFPGGYFGRGNVHFTLKRNDEALRDFDRVIALDPRNADALNGRANTLRRLGRDADALTAFDQALAIDPNHVDALAARANLLAKLLRHHEALACAEKVLARHPDHINALISRSDALAGLERFEEAIAGLDRVQAMDPKRALVKWNKSLLLLGLGHLAEGWSLYDSRFEADIGIDARPYPQPRLRDTHCDGVVMVWGEQGIGDHILYSGMIDDLKGRAGSIVFETDPRLVPLFARSFPSVTVIGIAAGENPPLYSGRVDAQIALPSLGGYFRNDFASFPRRSKGYLVADADRAKALRSRLARDGRTIVGLSWRSLAPRIGASKTVALREFEPVLRMRNCRFVDLQYGDTRVELAQVEREFGICVEHLDDIDNRDDIDSLAALTEACDLVVTVSNTTAHLAGALGKPVWVFVPHGHARIWYWFRDRRDSPWYPGVRVTRQLVGQPWSELMSSAVAEISAFAGSR